MGDLSPHFSISEFRCHGFGVPGHPDHPTHVTAGLIDALERAREIEGGRPIRIVSGHRCPWWNQRVGGAKQSRHVAGAAADVPRGAISAATAASAGFEGIGTRHGWAVHVDRRQRSARWLY